MLYHRPIPHENPASLYAVDQSQLDEFKTRLTNVLSSDDIKALNTLFYTKCVAPYQLDMTIYPLEYNLAHYVFDKVEFFPLHDPKVIPAADDSMVKVQTMNGHLYVPNLTPVKLCSVTFRSKNGHGSTGTMAPWACPPRRLCEICPSEAGG